MNFGGNFVRHTPEPHIMTWINVRKRHCEGVGIDWTVVQRRMERCRVRHTLVARSCTVCTRKIEAIPPYLARFAR